MPKLKYSAKRDIPIAVRELKSLDRHKIVEYVLNKFNKKILIGSIDTWFSRNKDAYEELQEWIKENAPTGREEEIDESIFIIGVFEQIPMVDEFIRGKKRKKTAKAKTLSRYVNELRNFCLGVKPSTNPETGTKYMKGEWAEQKKQWAEQNKRLKAEGKTESKKLVKGIDLKKHGWVLRHPERLSAGDVDKYLDLVDKHYPDADNSSMRISLRNYFRYHDIKGVDQISGRKHKGVGMYADLKVSKKIIFEMLDWMRDKARGFVDPYYQAYCACKFMYQTGTRCSATLNAILDNMNVREVVIDGKNGEKKKIANVTVYDKGSLSTHGERGHRWSKKITINLYNEMLLAAGHPERTTGEIFRISADDLRKISREAIEKFAPNLLIRYPMLKVIHFWRHIMGQHWLEATNWNYGIVAAIGGWSVKALEESYGKIPDAELREIGAIYLPELMIE